MVPGGDSGSRCLWIWLVWTCFFGCLRPRVRLGCGGGMGSGWFFCKLRKKELPYSMAHFGECFKILAICRDVRPAQEYLPSGTENQGLPGTGGRKHLPREPVRCRRPRRVNSGGIRSIFMSSIRKLLWTCLPGRAGRRTVGSRLVGVPVFRRWLWISWGGPVSAAILRRRTSSGSRSYVRRRTRSFCRSC